jgi:hypothetical protein
MLLVELSWLKTVSIFPFPETPMATVNDPLISGK